MSLPQAKETKIIEKKQNNKPPKMPYLKKTTKELVNPKDPQKIKIGYLDKLKIWKLWKTVYNISMNPKSIILLLYYIYTKNKPNPQQRTSQTTKK